MTIDYPVQYSLDDIMRTPSSPVLWQSFFSAVGSSASQCSVGARNFSRAFRDWVKAHHFDRCRVPRDRWPSNLPRMQRPSKGGGQHCPSASGSGSCIRCPLRGAGVDQRNYGPRPQPRMTPHKLPERRGFVFEPYGIVECDAAALATSAGAGSCPPFGRAFLIGLLT